MSYLSPVLWAFLPPQLTSALVPVACTFLPGLFPPAAPGTPLYRRNYRAVFTLLVGAWLAYAFVTRGEREPSYYNVLGVRYGADEGELKRAFRSLSRKYHPDRVGGGGDDEAVNARFVAIRRCYETLTEPTTRFIYDRFGPSAAACASCKSLKDYMQSGLLGNVGFYVAALLGLGLLGLAGKASAGSYWRYTVVVVLLTLELAIVLAPGSPAAASDAGPVDLASPPVSAAFASLGRVGKLIGDVLVRPLADHRAPFQVVTLLRRLTADLGIAISQLAGIWADDPADPLLLAWANLGMACDLASQAGTALNQTIGPLLAAGVREDELKEKITDRLLDSNIAKHPQVLPAYDTRMREQMRAVHADMRQTAQ